MMARLVPIRHEKRALAWLLQPGDKHGERDAQDKHDRRDAQDKHDKRDAQDKHDVSNR